MARTSSGVAEPEWLNSRRMFPDTRKGMISFTNLKNSRPKQLN